MSVHIFGIRHHGPGSARSLYRALTELQPDAILVEGPPDAQAVVQLAAHPGIRPPVALLIYRPDNPQRAAFYPFAVFSPEWQALQYGLQRGIPVRFMDLPQSYQLALPEEAQTGEEARTEDKVQHDPLGWIAEAAGYSDGERWWEHMVEQRQDASGLFEAILELMRELRQSAPPESDPLELQREAFMRQSIRTSVREGFARVAVICGAWHAPALAELPPEEQDRRLLEGLAQVEVAATWVPWTYGRLTFWSGYGAGIESPGWYQHLWEAQDHSSIRWVARVAELFRAEDLDASSAHVIEAVRLAETLSALRDRPRPGLPELNEAVQAVFCAGSTAPMQLIAAKLIVGDVLGEVPDETPMVPLQQDLQRLQRQLRLPPEAEQRTLDLDLRKPIHLERSHLLHRLNLLGVHWGEPQRAGGKQGSFHELWRIQWRPELSVALIEASVWGNTIAEAAAAKVRHIAETSDDLPVLTRLVEQVLLADLPEAIGPLMRRVEHVAALSSDIPHLMDALPPLANVLRYGNVRQTDTGMLGHVVDGLVTRICIGLPAACAALNDDAARQMFDRLLAVHNAITLHQNESHLTSWIAVLQQLADQRGVNGLLAGRCCRLLFELRVWDAEAVATHMNHALSRASEPPAAATWVEGFLQGSGQALLHNDALWDILDAWVTRLPGNAFTEILPLLRRTFATFSAAERRQMGERVRHGAQRVTRGPKDGEEIVRERADLVLPTVALLLGLELPPEGGG